jgi:hypothetical protein
VRDSLRNRPRLRGSLFTAVLFAAVLVGSRSAAPVSGAVVPCEPAPMAASRGEPAPTLLADEITRRLRRMGISFSHTRLAHPYDLLGEIC